MEGIKVSVKLLRDISVILSHKGKEQDSKKQFINTLTENNISLFFDIGANIGSYTWLAISNGVKESFLFEPDSTNQRLLSKTIKKNSLKRCFMVPFAVSDQIGVSEFIIDDASGATGSLEDHTKNTSSLHYAYGMKEKSLVPTLNLNIFTDYAKHQNVMIKIDVEGAEENVFKGSDIFFKEIHPFVLVECFDKQRLDYFKKLNYSIIPLAENCNYLLTPPKN